MNINIEVRYFREEVESMVINAHVARFGNAPEGMRWHVESTYGGRVEVKAVDTKETEAGEL